MPFSYSSHGVSVDNGATTVLEDRGNIHDLERSTLVSILSPTAYQSQLLSLFLDTVLSENPARITPAFSWHGSWLTQLATRTEVSSTLLHAIRALSLSFLGRQTKNDNLVRTSRLIYGKTLLKLNKSLQDPVEGLASDTLSATLLLTFYEMLNCTEQNSWVRHAGGAGHLMMLRGAGRHRTDFDKAIFLACRYAITMESYRSGKRCFLSSAPWRELSQQIHDSSPSKSAFEDAREAFFQEIVNQPGYITDSVDYMASGGRDHLVLQGLVRRGHMHRSNHKAIYNRCIEALKEAGKEPKEVPSSLNDKVFPVVYEFPEILVAAFLCNNWSILKMLNITLIGLEAKLSAIESTSQYSQVQMTPAQMLAARNIQLSRENLTEVIVAESTAVQNYEGTTTIRQDNVTGSGGVTGILPHRTSISPVTDRLEGSRVSETPTPAANSPADFPTMSASNTAKRRQMYVAENLDCAHQICKSVENVSTSGFLGPMFLIFSLRVVGRMLESPEEKEWILGKLEVLGRTWGVAAEGAREAALERRRYGGALGDSPRDGHIAEPNG